MRPCFILVVALLAVGGGGGCSAPATPERQPAPEIKPIPRPGEVQLRGAQPAVQARSGSLPAGAIDINLENFTYPFPVRFHELAVQGVPVKLAYMDVEPTGRANGRTIVLLHGKNFCGAYWARTAKDLAAEGFRVVIPDHVGFGKSTKPTDVQYSLQMMASAHASLLDALRLRRVSVLGHSMGGMLAIRFALMYPDRVEALALENPIGLEDWKRAVPYRPVEAWYRQEIATTYQSAKDYQLKNYYHGEWREDYEPWARLLGAVAQSPDYPRWAHVQALTSDMLFTQPVCYELDQLKPRTLLIIGQADRPALGKDAASPEDQARLGNYPRLGREAAAIIPGATLIELNGVGHVPHLESYDRFWIALSAFLASSDEPRPRP